MASVDFLNNVNGEVQLALLVGNQVVPVIKGVVKEVKTLLGDQTLDYQVVISTGTQELDDVVTEATDTLNQINQERVAAGQDPLPIPGS